MTTNPHNASSNARLRRRANWELRQKAGVVLGPLVFLAVGLGLAQTGLSSKAAWTGATVTLMATWWITEPIPLWATACLPLLLFPVLGTAPVHEVALTSFDPVNFLFLGGMLIAAAMQQWGLHRRIALEIVTRIGASPRRIVLGFMLATTFITLWISNTATAMMMFPIGLAVVKKFEERGDDPLVRQFGLALMLGIAYAASIGGIGTKIGTGPNLVFVKYAPNVLPREIDFVTWLKVGMPVVLVAIPLVWLYLVRFAARLPAVDFAGGRETIERERALLGRMSVGERIALAAFLAAAFLWIFRKDIDLGTFIIPGWWDVVWFSWSDVLDRPVSALPAPWPGLLADTGDGMVAITIGLALLMTPIHRKPIRFALALRHAAKIPWGLLVLLGGGFAMAYGIQRSGLSAAIADMFKGMGPMNPFVAMVMVCAISTALTEVASNVATASILVPLLAVSAESFGLHPAPLMFAATLAASFGFMLPAGTPPNAIAFSSGYISVPQMVRCGLIVDLVGMWLVATVCYWLAPWALGVG